jgi:hypothetical protein
MASMETFMAVCLALIVLELGIMIVVFSVAMVKVRDAAQAVEIAAYRVDQEVSSFGSTLRGGWVSALKSVFTLVGSKFFS